MINLGLFFLNVSSYAQINKKSIQLGRTIQATELCGDKSLVKVRKDHRISKLLHIDLNSLGVSVDALIPYNSLMLCDELTGAYYLTNVMNENNQEQIGLHAYEKLGDTKPVWQYVIDDKFAPVIMNLISTEKTVIIGISYIHDKAPKELPNVIVFDKTNGNKLWEFSLAYPIEQPKLSVLNNILYVTSNNGYIRAYNLETFAQSWEIANKLEDRYVQPTLDKATNTLITGVQYYGRNHNYVEIIGINPTDGQIKWRLLENQSLYFPEINNSSKLIYMQVTSIHKLNWYNLEENEPKIEHQWSKMLSSLLSPSGIYVIGNRVIVTFGSNEPDKYAYVFDDTGKKVDEIVFEDQESLVLNHSAVSNHTIYATGNGEFGTLDFN